MNAARPLPQDLTEPTTRRRIRSRALVLGVLAVGCWVTIFLQSDINWWWLLVFPAGYLTIVSVYFAKHLWLTRSRGAAS